MDELMWDEESGMHYDLFLNGSRTPFKTVAALYPLLAAVGVLDTLTLTLTLTLPLPLPLPLILILTLTLALALTLTRWATGATPYPCTARSRTPSASSPPSSAA